MNTAVGYSWLRKCHAYRKNCRKIKSYTKIDGKKTTGCKLETENPQRKNRPNRYYQNNNDTQRAMGRACCKGERQVDIKIGTVKT